jgi:hypothetical protein
MSAVEYNLAANHSAAGTGMDEPQQNFAFGFVQFLLARDLAHIDYADCLIDWVERAPALCNKLHMPCGERAPA